MTRRLTFLLLILVIFLPTLLTGCAASDKLNTADLKLAPLSEMPAEVKQASVTVQDASGSTLPIPI